MVEPYHKTKFWTGPNWTNCIKCGSNDDIVPKRTENIVKKGGNASYLPLLYPQCFQMPFFPGLYKHTVISITKPDCLSVQK